MNGNKIVDFVHFQTLINCNHNQGKHSYIALKQQLCGSTNSNTIAPHVFMHVGKGHKRSTSMYNCFFDNDPEYNGYEIFVDESKASRLNDNDCAYGVYYGHKNPLNSNYKVYGKNSLQNATLQGVEMILKTVPEDININIYIDRESVLKVLWSLPLTPREEHHTVELNMIKRIYSLITKRTGNTTFKQVFSHLTDTNSSKSPETIEKHLKAMQDMYGEVRAARLMKGNQGADTEASSGLFRLVPKAPTINK